VVVVSADSSWWQLAARGSWQQQLPLEAEAEAEAAVRRITAPGAASGASGVSHCEVLEEQQEQQHWHMMAEN
jgi:hypothetical protein